MGKVDMYKEKLTTLKEWDAFLLRGSGLPGPRANLELAQAVADVATIGRIENWLKWTSDKAPANSREEFLAFCGVLGLGRLAAEGRVKAPLLLRKFASDPRWRIREAVVMALQQLGVEDMNRLFAVAEDMAGGKPLEQRAACVALCGPRLLTKPSAVRRALKILDRVTAKVEKATVREGEAFDALRKALGSCWSVAAEALPDEGKAAMERWFGSGDKDVQRIMKENLKKDRLARMDREWVRRWRTRLND